MNPFRNNNRDQQAIEGAMIKRPFQFTIIWHVFTIIIMMKVASKWPIQGSVVFWLVVFTLFVVSCVNVLLHTL